MFRTGTSFVLCSALGLACAHSDRDRAWVSRSLQTHGIATSTRTTGGIVNILDQGLDEYEAVALALARNPVYQADLARLDSTRADLAEAGRLPNPQLTLLGGLGPISSSATLLAPLDALWQLPQRTRMAARALEATAESLVQNGLNLARDVRVAHAERALAEDRVRLRGALVQIWEDLARLAEVRSRLGETSPADAAQLRAEAALAVDALTASESEREVAAAQLRNALGLTGDVPRFDLTFSAQVETVPALSELTVLARSARPDVRAAELSVRSAIARTGWEKARVVAIAGQVEGHWTRPDQPAARVGGRLELPIFNANVGGIGRAEAEVTRAVANLAATRQRVLVDVLQARARLIQATTSRERYRAQILPALEEAQHVAARNYELGEELYLTVLQASQRLGEARLREVELTAEVRRSHAELERAVAAHVGEKP